MNFKAVWPRNSHAARVLQTQNDLTSLKRPDFLILLVSELLDETQTLVATVEAAAVDGLNGNYVLRITTAINNIRNNIDQCPNFAQIQNTVQARIKKIYSSNLKYCEFIFFILTKKFILEKR